MKIVWFNRKFAGHIEKSPMVVADDFRGDGEMTKDYLMEQYFDGNILYYPDIPIIFGGEEETLPMCEQFMEVAMNCPFEPVYAAQTCIGAVIATEITLEIFKLVKSSLCPYFWEDKVYKVGNQLLYHQYVNSNGEYWGCQNKWLKIT